MAVLKYRDPGTGVWHMLRSTAGDPGPAGPAGQPGRDGVTYTQADADGRWLRLDGSGRMLGVIDADGNGVVSAGAGAADTDAATVESLAEQPPLYPVQVVGSEPVPRGAGDLWVDTSAPVLEWDTGWKYPTLLNGWQNYGDGHTPVRYRLMPGGVVKIEGVVRNANTGQTGVIFNLDAGYCSTRSDDRLIFMGIASGSVCRIDVLQSQVRLESWITGANAAVVSIQIEFCIH